MEVIIKKAKITSSIFNQMLIASSLNLRTFNVLGFCVFKNAKWIVLYEPSTNGLRKYPYIKDVYNEKDDYNKKLVVRINFEGRFNDEIYVVNDDQEGLDFFQKIKTVMRESTIKGQFYI